MRVLVTGADGFTGLHLGRELESHGHTMVPLECDITDPAALDRAIGAADFDAVIHLAGIAFVGEKDFGPFYKVNQIGTFNLLEAIERHRLGCRVLVASSANIYGDRHSGAIDESTAANPVNHYGLSKYAMELGLPLFDGLDIVVARPFNYTGVGQAANFLVPKIVGHFRRSEGVIELGNIDVERDIGDVRSVVAAYRGLIEKPEAKGVFNVSRGEATALREIVRTAEDIAGRKIEVRVNPDFVRPNEIATLCGDNSRLRAALPDWSPIPLHATLEWMLGSETG